MIKYKKIFYTCMIVGLPFFAKGIHDTKQDLNTSNIIKTGFNIDIPKYNIEPLIMDKNLICNYQKMAKIKDSLNIVFGYDTTDLCFEIKSFEDNSVKYMRPDSSGFVRISGSRTWRNQNPGALRSGPFARKMGAVGDAGGFAVFPNEEIGMHALRELLKTETYSSMSIADALHKYAPFCDNNDPILYKQHIFQMTGVDPKRKISDLSDVEMERVVNTIKIIEGWKPGQQTGFGEIANILQNLDREYES